LLHNEGIQQVLSPLSTKGNQQTVCIDNFTLIVYPFIQGQDGFSRNLTNDQWIILGKTLRHIHDYQLPPLIKDHVKKESYSPQWRDAVRSVYHYIETEPKIVDETALKLLTFMKKYRHTIERLVNCAEQLAQIIQKQSPELVLCHSDIHAGNVLIAENGALFIVDWDQPIMAAKERDLMFIGAGVANTWNNPHEEELFYAGYGKTNINKEILTYYRHERIVEDIAIYSQELLLTTEGGAEREVMYKHFTDMFEPRNVVEIAFKNRL
jgi:spectinomycin phosphotransferase